MLVKKQDGGTVSIPSERFRSNVPPAEEPKKSKKDETESEGGWRHCGASLWRGAICGRSIPWRSCFNRGINTEQTVKLSGFYIVPLCGCVMTWWRCSRILPPCIPDESHHSRKSSVSKESDKVVEYVSIWISVKVRKTRFWQYCHQCSDRTGFSRRFGVKSKLPENTLLHFQLVERKFVDILSKLSSSLTSYSFCYLSPTSEISFDSYFHCAWSGLTFAPNKEKETRRVVDCESIVSWKVIVS